MGEVAIRYRLEAERCFSIACTANDPTLRQESLDAALYWFRLADQLERRKGRANLRVVRSL
jgi:hypothetical protein